MNLLRKVIQLGPLPAQTAYVLLNYMVIAILPIRTIKLFKYPLDWLRDVLR